SSTACSRASSARTVLLPVVFFDFAFLRLEIGAQWTARRRQRRAQAEACDLERGTLQEALLAEREPSRRQVGRERGRAGRLAVDPLEKQRPPAPRLHEAGERCGESPRPARTFRLLGGKEGGESAVAAGQVTAELAAVEHDMRTRG